MPLPVYKMGGRLLIFEVILILLLGSLTVTSVVTQQLDNGEFGNMDNITQTLNDRLEHCRATAGDDAVKDIQESFEELMNCVQKYIKWNKLQHEVNVSYERGELDLVFKKYCKKRDQLMSCAEDVFTKLERCSNEEEKENLNITRKVIDAGIDFVCYNNGDRIALFMAEKGEECLKNHSTDIKHCVEDKVPSVKNLEKNSGSMDIAGFTFTEENCKKFNMMQDCVVEHTSKCDDETPANILGSLITQMLKAIPCSQTSSASTLVYHTQHLLPHLLTLLAAALAAANILL